MSSTYRHIMSVYDGASRSKSEVALSHTPARNRVYWERAFGEAICRGAASWILRCIPAPCCPRLPLAAASCPFECGIGLFAPPATAQDASRPGDEYGK